MQQDFWLERWENNEIGFHLEGRANPCLDKYWQLTQTPVDKSVFVPLCGKSLDLLWFSQQGYRVIGIELAERAVIDFFAENQLQPAITQEGPFKVYRADNITLYCGDFFALASEHLKDCAGFYDRAALVAWSPEAQSNYAAHLLQILPAAARGLVMVMDYPQQEMSGPPFAVSEQQMQTLFAADCQLQRVGQRDILKYEPRFAERGLTSFLENAFIVEKRG